MENAPSEETGQWKHDLEESQLFSIRKEIRKDVAPHGFEWPCTSLAEYKRDCQTKRKIDKGKNCRRISKYT